MDIGTDKVSKHQLGYLELAKKGISPRELSDIFISLIDDGEITDWSEQIHPEWVGVFNTNRDRLRSYTTQRTFERIQSFVDKLQPFDPGIADLDPKALRMSFLLGAGASKPAPSGIPTVKELLPQLLERARRLDRDDVTKLADFCEHRKIDNIEDLLTAAQLATFSSRNPNILRLINYLLYRGESDEPYETIQYTDILGTGRAVPRMIRRPREAADLSSVAFLQDTLQVLFGLLSSTMLPAKPNSAHEAIAQYAKDHPGTSIVTTNYDCCVDLSLGELSKDLVYGIDFANVTQDQTSTGNCARLIKLHGSLNWFYCETCQEVQLIDIGQIVKNFLEDKVPYPVIGICKDCGGQRRGLLVPPLAMKFDLAPPLAPLTTDAKTAFDNADLIVVVGFSFAEADVYISRMISKSMQTSPAQKLLVVDPDDRVVKRVRRKFKASIPNFDPTRIIRVVGDCAKVLPRFLEGEFSRKVVAEGALDTATGKGPLTFVKGKRFTSPQEEPSKN